MSAAPDNDASRAASEQETAALPDRRATFWQVVGPLLALAAVYGVFALIAVLSEFGVWPDTYRLPIEFISFRNVETMVRHTAIVGVAALGMTFVIVSAGIDLSIGSAIALVTVVIAVVLRQVMPEGEDGGAIPWHIPLLAAMAGVVAGMLGGALNGLIITRLRVVPFIVTLGSMLLLRGAAKGLANENRIEAPATWINELMATLPVGLKWLLFPPGVWLFLVLALIMAAILRYTRLGRHTFAIGSNEETARLCGVHVENRKLAIYAIAGLMAGVAGVLQFSRLQVGDPSVAVGLELNVIAAVVIGGGSLSGGEGSILGTMVGAAVMTVIATGCSQMGLPSWVQEVATGCIIIVAVTLDQMRHRRSA